MATKGEGSKGGRPKSEPKKSADQEISHVVNHPIRLDGYLATFEKIASPTQLSKLFRKPLGSVSFHMNELRKAGVVDLVKTIQRRGAIEHFYRAVKPPEIDEKEWKKLSRPARREVMKVGVGVVVAEILSALRHKTLETDDEMYLVWLPMKLSRKGEEEVEALQAENLERLKAIKEEFAADEQDVDSQTRVAVSLWFERGQKGLRRPRDVGGIKELE